LLLGLDALLFFADENMWWVALITVLVLIAKVSPRLSAWPTVAWVSLSGAVDSAKSFLILAL